MNARSRRVSVSIAGSAGKPVKHGIWPLEWPPLYKILCAAFLVVLCAYLPLLLIAAQKADDKYHGTVSDGGDGRHYQTLAINLLHGKGFAEGVVLPLETYRFDLGTPAGKAIKEHYELYGPGQPLYTFYRAPGLPFLLAGLYAVFGNYTLVAREALAIMVWLTAIILLLLGIYLDKWRGALAGGLVGLIYLTFYVLLRPRDPFFESIMAEGPATLFFVVFGFLLVMYLKESRLRYLCLAALPLVGTIFLRPNFVVVIPFLLLYLFVKAHTLRGAALFSTIIILPIMIWSAYASTTLGRFVAFTNQSEPAFPQCNNVDVLEGIGPERRYQGDWNPGWVVKEDGTVVNDNRNSVRLGENGWVKGLIFWRDHITQVPRLFFVKLRAGFWFSERRGWADQVRVRLYSLGLGFIFLAIGLKNPPREVKLFPRLTSKHIILIQLGLVAFLFLIGNMIGYLAVLLVFASVLLLALLRPYGDVYRIGFPSPEWFMCFMMSHAIVTMLFLGIRYHQPMDPFVLLYGILGSIIVFDELILKRRFGVVLDSQLAG